MDAAVVTDLNTLSPAEWNALPETDNPFLRHEFLAGLEAEGCVSPELGWQPYHLVFRDDRGIAAAMPGYLKGHSWGEFVFDWAWADAYERNGLAYYPKLVHAVPYTPATGPRVLVRPDVARTRAIAAAVAASRELVARQGLSSAHWLFPEPEEAEALAAEDLLCRTGCQFHWHNDPGYRDFEDFLDRLTSKRRKSIRRERRQVRDAGVELHVRPGQSIPAEDWRVFHQLYTQTFEEHGNLPVLTPGFFSHCGRTLGDRVIMVQARRQGALIAGALLFRSGDALFGRYWGSFEAIPGLHFETCYYQGIAYCIDQGIQRFEPGAQGEHKISRGFLPTATHSRHWIADGRFRAAIADFLGRETPMVERYIQDMGRHSPYKTDP
ncbi:GNAT family N-acetyltransferase [Aquisalimonas lutea]|uniref:GNAT family N-acetyltransferase n=1 Tax=Aquisalimonas lutea TaxID=1327750 RepID=UPI0025B597FD|nr:GNAT family N-acetyltransferase [Aquisalimonas lutea]MDN3518598.1 GNAT family N-acetyltransferase [Aquisalimonas lutea]